MLDSGASCNFVSLDLVRTLGLSYDVVDEQTVRLANGKQLPVVGKVFMNVKFVGGFKYCGTFIILDCSCPLILGMQFFTSVKPDINWSERKVFVRSKKGYQQLHTCTVDFGIQKQQQSMVQGGLSDIQVDNMFNDLPVEQDSGYTDTTVGFEVAPVRNTSVQVSKKVYKLCKGCSKVLVQGQTYRCSKCENRSFEHQRNDLVAHKAKVVEPVIQQQNVDRKDVKLGQWWSKAHNCKYEMVNLRQFVRGGKQQQYLNFGVIQLHQQVDNMQLNFTHRATLGGGDDADVQHGQLDNLAKSQLEVLKNKYSSVFQEPQYPVDRSSCPQQFFHEIPLKDENAEPPKRRLYPLDSVELVELKQQIKEFLESNRIEPSNGPYGAPILFAKKKDGGLRMCIDYRMLNQQTCSDVYPLPRIDELLQRLDGACIFSKLDLRDGYHQIPMSELDKQKTAFTCRYGTFQFTVMPFGLSTAPSTFQRMMNQVFFELLDNGVLCYLDDLLIYSKSIQEHKILLDRVFSILQKYKLHIKESKCHLFLEKVNFLGHVVDKNGLSLESGKVDAVQKWPVPENVTQVQQFLGLCNYYRRFVLRFSEIAGPLTKLTRKGVPFVWDKQQQIAFDRLKQSLCNAPVLKIFDPVLETRVVCDASNFCCGAVLEQKVGGRWHPVEYYSKRLSQAERNYSATDREFVAIKLSLERWRQFLVGKQFVLLTDHAALTYLQSTATVSRRNARWLEFLSQFQFEIKHIKGRENIVADALSRIPGTEQLSVMQLCSMKCTLGVKHFNDLPVKLVSSCSTTSQQLVVNSVITIHENDSFLQQLLDEQQQSTNSWFLQKVQLAKDGSSVFQYRNGLLCKLVADTFCPVVPDPQSRSVQIILSDLHNSSLGGHFGQKKLLKLVAKRFYWKQMFKSIEQFCKHCSVCQQNKSSTQKPIGLLQPLENPSKPFEHISMDFIFNLPVSQRGYDGIFTVVDRFSRMVRFIPCKSTIDAYETAQLLFEHWICRFGMPQKIVSDRDTRFQSKFWQCLMKQLQCRIAMSTAFHPQTDGLTERFHRSVEQVLRCYCSEQQDLWCSLLSQCEFALNNTHQDAISTSPFRVVFGSSPSIPLDHTLSRLQVPSVHDLVSARSHVHTQVTAALAASQQRMQGVANPKRRSVEFQQGSKVWLSTANLPLKLGSRKLASKYTGPFEILKVVSPEAYRLHLPSAWRIHDVFHSSQLKPVHGSPVRPQPVILEDTTEEYEVERILKMRLARGGKKKEFLVRWKGYSSFDDSWEPEENLENCKQLVQRFLGTGNGQSKH